MYNIDYKNLKKGYTFGIVFFLAGLLFFIILGYATFGDRIKKNFTDSQVKAIHSELKCFDNGSCTANYTYRVDNIEYLCSTPNVSDNNFKKNIHLVYYKKGNPSFCVNDVGLVLNIILILSILLPSLFIFIGINHCIKVTKNIKRIKKLSEIGHLIKDIPYCLVETGMSIKGKKIMAISIEYKLPAGSTVRLTSTPRYDYKILDEDGLVDLLIDLNDPTNYHIDFEISKKY